MTKQINKTTCVYCESVYKVIYDEEETNGQPRFCPFCGEEPYEAEDELMAELEDE